MSKRNIKSVTVEWYDDLTPESYKLVLPKYSLKCVDVVPMVDGNYITVVGAKADVDAFAEDFEDDAFEKLDLISLQYDDDDDYIVAVNDAIADLAGSEIITDHVEL